MARTTKTPDKVSRNKSGTPIVRASKLFPGRPKRMTREKYRMTDSALEIYQGRYRHRMGSGIILEFAAIDDVLQVEASGFPSGKLRRTGEHAFVGIGFPRSFEFESSEADHSLHLTVVPPESDEPDGDVFDRIEPWERSVGAPAESIDLGWLSLCVHADPLEPTTEFYARLGFRFVSPDLGHGPLGGSPDPRTMRQGES